MQFLYIFRSATERSEAAVVLGEKAMINELSRGDSTGPGVDHDCAVIELRFMADLAHIPPIILAEVLLCTNRIVRGLSSADPFTLVLHYRPLD